MSQTSLIKLHNIWLLLQLEILKHILLFYSICDVQCFHKSFLYITNTDNSRYMNIGAMGHHLYALTESSDYYLFMHFEIAMYYFTSASVLLSMIFQFNCGN
jgi:hypothetical protein